MSIMRSRRQGVSLIELLVALLVLELAGLSALAAALSAGRIERHLTLGVRTDAARWAERRAAELASTCRMAPTPQLVDVGASANAARRAVTIAIRCGR